MMGSLAGRRFRTTLGGAAVSLKVVGLLAGSPETLPNQSAPVTALKGYCVQLSILEGKPDSLAEV